MAVVEDALGALEEHRALNAALTVCAEESRARVRAGVTGRLAGVPLLVKDFFDTAGVRTTYGSRIYAERVPERTAPAVRALEAEGAVIVAKTNLDEFAWGVTGQNPHWGDTQNPRLPGRLAGGSSAGNAALLAAGAAPLALGTDTGGSVRMPAACCAVVGLKPPVGRIPTEGVFPLCPSFDSVGPMARTVADAALAYSVLTGLAVPAARAEGLRVGALTYQPRLDAGEEELERDERALALGARFEALGAEAREIELPAPTAGLWPLFYAEAGASHRVTFPSRRDDYGPTCRAKLEVAARTDPAAAAAAAAALGPWRQRAAAELEVDVVVSPTLGVREIPPLEVDEQEIRISFSAYTRTFSFLGWPAIAMGDVQLSGPDEATVLAAALAWEAAYGPPPA